MRLARGPRGAWFSRQAGVLLVAVALTVLAACSSGSHQSQAQGGASSPAQGGASSPAHGRASSPAAARTPRQYISFTSYPGWIQGSIPPGKFNYAPWTVISDFGLWPTATGGIAVGDMRSLSNIPAVVAAAHKAGKKVIMALGEQGLGPAFASAASPRYQPTLITSITNYLAKYGFDGVDIDWEEDVPQNEASYVSLIKNLRATFQREFPNPVFLSADVDTGQVPPGIAAQIAPYVNTLNMETFQDNGISSAVAYTSAGIPASKLLMGIGVAGGYYDTSESRVAAKVRYVEAHGLGGTLLWQPGNLNTDLTDPRLIPLEQMLHSSS
jgi:Glycosyl hydrolases family 18